MTLATRAVLLLIVALAALEIGLTAGELAAPSRRATVEVRAEARAEEHTPTFKDFDDPGIGPLL